MHYLRPQHLQSIWNHNRRTGWLITINLVQVAFKSMQPFLRYRYTYTHYKCSWCETTWTYRKCTTFSIKKDAEIFSCASFLESCVSWLLRYRFAWDRNQSTRNSMINFVAVISRRSEQSEQTVRNRYLYISHSTIETSDRTPLRTALRRRFCWLGAIYELHPRRKTMTFSAARSHAKNAYFSFKLAFNC